LAESARALLDHLPRNTINRWDDLWEAFTGNFQGTYVHPGNPWDLKGCRQKQGESLRDYIRCFSQKCHTLPSVVDANVVSAFWDGTIKELLEIVTRHAWWEEAVRAAFALVEAVVTAGGV
jgi:hypothetical protein